MAFETEPSHINVIISSLEFGTDYLDIVISLNVIKKCICFLMLYICYIILAYFPLKCIP